MQYNISRWWAVYSMLQECSTRPNIAYAVRTVSKFSNEPTVAYLTAVKKIFR